MSKSEPNATQFWYERSATSYISNFFLTLLVIVYSLLLLNKDDKHWSFYASVFTGVCLFSLLVSGLKWGRVMLSGARVFYHMQTPVSLWHGWQRAILTRTSLSLIVLCCVITSLELSHQSLLPTSALLAMASLALAGGFSLPLAFNHYLNKRCYLLLLAFAAYLAYISFYLGTKQWINASFEWHLPAMLAWPILAVATLLYWEKPPAQKGKTLFLKVKELGIISNLRHFYLRFTELGSINALEKKDGLATSGKIMKNMGLFWCLFISSMLIVDWQASVTLPHLLFLVMIAACSSSYIVVKDLHWRFLLLPKHFQQARIANHLLISSVMYYGCWAIILFLVLLGSKMFFSTPMTLNRTESVSLYNIAILVIELISAFCIGLVIRGSKKPGRSFFYLFMMCLLVTSVAALYFYVQQQNPITAAVFTMNTTYVLCVVGIGIVALIYANKLWTRERLLAYL
ncbi:hypothetical protein [Undibacterium sp. Di24W]|uniref:hypothetical protein n=1 Tax=Undibacterium sp. Di24W TaxID=3413033 RepID=UPI003BF2B93F